MTTQGGPNDSKRDANFLMLKPVPKPENRFQSLDADKISETIEVLAARIDERFPQSGLRGVCEHLLTVSRRAKAQAESIDKPDLGLRVVALLLISCIGAALLCTFFLLKKPTGGFDAAQFVQLLESSINDVLLIGAGVFFLATLETRVKRERALKALHELRALAHIIDMHQLTKDPERTVTGRNATASSPTKRMSALDLERYLDYCSEMLSLIGKIAALYIQKFDDAVALAAVNEIEVLTTSLSNKIWQKVIVLHSMND